MFRDLESLTAEQLASIVSLPFRVGVWIGFAEDEEGPDDDRLERRALAATLKSIEGDKSRRELVRHIAGETLKHQNHWEQWAGQVSFRMPDVDAPLAALRDAAAAADEKAYREMLYDIAVAVASAYGEFGDRHEPPQGRVSAFLGDLMQKMRKGTEEYKISATEQDAIDALRTALRLDRPNGGRPR